MTRVVAMRYRWVMAAPHHRLRGSPTRVVARRGLIREAHENTLAAFEAALREGSDGVAIDVGTTRDGTLVCFRDEPETRRRLLGDDDRPLVDRDLCEVRELSLAQEVRYPTGTLRYRRVGAVARLEDALAVLPAAASVVLHLAPQSLGIPSAPSYRVSGRTAELVERMGLSERAILTSSDAFALHRARRATRGRVRTAYQWADRASLVGAWEVSLRPSWSPRDGFGRSIDRLKTSGPARRLLGSATAAAIEFTALGVELLREISAAGALTGTFTLFPIELSGMSHGLDGTLQARILARLAAAGLDWVETDDPRRAHAVVNRGWTGALDLG